MELNWRKLDDYKHNYFRSLREVTYVETRAILLSQLCLTFHPSGRQPGRWVMCGACGQWWQEEEFVTITQTGRNTIQPQKPYWGQCKKLFQTGKRHFFRCCSLSQSLPLLIYWRIRYVHVFPIFQVFPFGKNFMIRCYTNCESWHDSDLHVTYLHVWHVHLCTLYRNEIHDIEY